MKFKVLLICMLAAVFSSHATRPHQHTFNYISIAVNNYITAKPFNGFPKLFYSQFHPGLTVSSGFNWVNRARHSWSQAFKASVFHHRYIQTAITLYSEFGYRYKSKNWGYTIAFGGGYLHMIPGTQQFKQDDNGDWHQVKLPSRPQGMLSLSLGIDRLIGKKNNRVFVRYQNILQTPFIPGYVPLLPYNVFHLGLSVPMVNLKKGEKDAK